MSNQSCVPSVGQAVGDLDAVLRLLGPRGGDVDVAREADRHADLAVCEVRDVLRRVEVADVRPHLHQEVRRLLEVGGIGGRRIEAEIGGGDLQHVGRRIEHGDAAVGELRGILRIEDQLPAVDRRLGAQPLLDLGLVVADADGAPHVDHGMLVAGIVGLRLLHQRRVHVLEVRQLRLVERQVDARPDLPLQEVRGRHHDVVAGVAGEQLRLQHLVRVIDVVDDLDARLRLELRHRVLGDIVRPVVDVQHVVLGQRRQRREPRDRGSEKTYLHAIVCPFENRLDAETVAQAIPPRAEDGIGNGEAAPSGEGNPG